MSSNGFLRKSDEIGIPMDHEWRMREFHKCLSMIVLAIDMHIDLALGYYHRIFAPGQ